MDRYCFCCFSKTGFRRRSLVTVFAYRLDGARGIVYVVDSATVTRQIRDVAEYLFNILTNPRIHALR
jgi:hypothetical protein